MRSDGLPASLFQNTYGALRYLLDDVQQHREQEREPTITESKDSPYRVTGGIPLVGRDPRAEGASTHWYNYFADPKT